MNDHSQVRTFEHKLSDDESADGGRGLNLKEKIRILFRRKALIITTVLLITSVVALISFSLPPRYMAVASVLIEEGRTNVVDTQATGEAVIDESADSRALAAELNLLRSRTYAQAIVEELDLLMKPEFNPILEGKVGPLQILAERFATLSDMMPESLLIDTGLAELIKPAEAVTTKEAMASLPPPGSEAYEDLMRYAVGAMLNRLQIKAGGTNLILIRAQSSDPEQAAQIADEVARLYVADQLEIKQDAVDQAIEWLGQRVTDLRNRVLTAEGSVVEFREEHGLLGVNTSRSDSGGSVLSDAATTRSERVAKEELLAWVKELRNQGAGLDAITAVLPLPSLAQLREKQRNLDRQEAILRQKFGGQHREIIQLDGGRHPINFERDHVNAQIGAELGAAIRKLEGELAFAKRREAETEVLQQPAPEVVTPDAQADARAEVQLRDLERQAEADRSLYVAFLNRFQEVSEQRNLLKSTATVASRAGVPGEPEFPKPMLMIIGGFTLSLTLGTMLAFFAEYMDSSLRTGRQIERLLNLPTLAFVPKVSEVKKRGELHRYLIDNPRSAYAEAVRTVQIATLDAIDTGDPIDAETPAPVVLVTSSLPGEGKTTLALSLAASSACSGRKAVIVDLDLRRPRQHHEAGLGQGPGLVEVLEDDVDLDDVLYTDPGNANLDILPAGRLPNSPADLLCSPIIACLITELRERYDYIVLDSPPLLGVIDAKLAARLADAVLFVTQWEKTKEAAAKSGIGNLLDRNTPPIGAVLTQVDVRRHAKRGYGESIQYHKKYEAYYDN